MTFVSMMITDKFGRRSLMVYSMTLMGICLLALSYYFFSKKYNPHVAETLDWLPLVAIVLYISMFSIGCGPIPYIIIGEIFSSEVSRIIFFAPFFALTVTRTHFTVLYVCHYCTSIMAPNIIIYHKR